MLPSQVRAEEEPEGPVASVLLRVPKGEGAPVSFTSSLMGPLGETGIQGSPPEETRGEGWAGHGSAPMIVLAQVPA